jgi:hypothetical protein
MNFNWFFIPTLILSTVLFFYSQYIWQRLKSKQSKMQFLFLSLFLFIPGFLIIVYYFHVLDQCVWFYQFRSIPGTELFIAGLGPLSGILALSIAKIRFVSRPFIFTLFIIAVSIPYLKPLLAPLDYDSLDDNCVNGVFLQSSGATCGPACAATILKYYGIPATEQEIAKECYTYVGGTEIWYIVRALHKRGMTCKFQIQKEKPLTLPYPAIAGIDIGAGHFITILNKTGDSYTLGDPLVGKKVIDESDIRRRINFTGFFLVVRKD